MFNFNSDRGKRMIALSLYLCFVAWRIAVHCRKRKPKTTTYQTPQRTQAQIRADQARAEREQAKRERQLEQIEQAEIDAPFYESQLDDFVRMHRDALQVYDAMQKEVETDQALNKHGAVVSIKTASRHIAQRDRALKSVLQYERMIHSTQAKLDKANRILKTK